MSCPTDVGIYVSKSCDCRSIVKRRAFTLVELLVSVTLTLLVVFAIVQIFDVLGSNMRLGRALIEMSGQMRTVTNRLQQDLDNVTCQVKPWNDPESGSGYFTYIEGRTNDRDAVGEVAGQLIRMSDGIFDALDDDGSPDQDTHYGDWDDGLALTVRSPDRPFVGRMVAVVGGTLTTTTIQSQEVEVLWWMAFIDTNGDGVCQTSETTVLLRRVFLVAPNAINHLYDGLGTDDGILIVEQSDISVRHDPTSNHPVANTLADLTQPDSRAAAQRSGDSVYAKGFPSSLSVSNLDGTASTGTLNDGVAFGDYVVLTDVLAFDIRAYDPLAPIVSVNGIAIAPGDPGYPPPKPENRRGPADDLERIPADDLKWIVGEAITDRDIDGNGNVLTVDTAYGPAEMIGRGAYVDLGYLVDWRYADPLNPRIVFKPSDESDYDEDYSDLGAIGNWFADGNDLGRISHFSGLPAFDDQLPRNNLRDAGERFWNPSTGRKELSDAVAYSGFAVVPTFYYDTWTSFYERDGEDQDGDDVADEGTDGLDSDLINGVDDPGERETSPPYPVDLRGIEVRIRMMDFNTRQVRQVSVVGDFVPE